MAAVQDIIFIVILCPIVIGCVALLYGFTVRVKAEHTVAMERLDQLIAENRRKLRALVERGVAQ